MSQRTDGRGVVSQYAHDDAGHITSATYPAQTALNVAYVYDATAGGNPGIGRLTSLTDAAGRSPTCDILGRVVRKSARSVRRATLPPMNTTRAARSPRSPIPRDGRSTTTATSMATSRWCASARRRCAELARLLGRAHAVRSRAPASSSPTTSANGGNMTRTVASPCSRRWRFDQPLSDRQHLCLWRRP